MKLASRLFLGSLAVVGVLVLLVVTMSSRRLEDRIAREAIEHLEREALLIATLWTSGVDPDSLANAAGAVLQRRVTLIAPDGRVLGDSDFDRPAIERLGSHSDRPEVAAALEGRAGRDRRVSASTGEERIYAAVPAAPGVARVSVLASSVDTLTAGVFRDVLVAGLLALAVALVLSAIFAREVTRPLEELRDVARDIAAGDLSRRPSLSAPGEVGDLSTTLHLMTDQLAGRLDALQAEDALTTALLESLNEGVVAVDSRRLVVRINAAGRRLLGVDDETPFSADLLPRERAVREALESALDGDATAAYEVNLEDRIVALTARPLPAGGAVLAVFDLTTIRKLEKVRRDFVANVSHELKTPLTIIGGFAETLADDDPPEEQRRQFAEAIRANALRMQRIVDDLLDLSRIESGGWVPNPVRLDARTAIEEALLGDRDEAQKKNVSITVGTDDAPHLYADPTAVRQVISNLVENSIRYTPAGGTISIVTREHEDGIRLDVIDTGIGIPHEHLPRIFERFYRVDQGRARDAGGTGLGLAIVRHLAEAHGGHVTADSAPGKGTRISVYLPYRGIRAP